MKRWSQKLRKPRFLLVYPLVMWMFLTARVTEPALRLGIALFMIGEAIRVWANGCVGHVKVNQTDEWVAEPKVGRLVTGGPYAYVRHPLYVGSALIGLGFVVIVGQPWFGLAAAIVLPLVYHRKIVSEEDLLLHELPEEYQRYQQAVPRYVPTWRRYPDANARWSWEGIWASKELKTVVWVAAMSILLYFREEYWQERELFASPEWMKHTVLMTLLVVLVATDGLLEVLRRLRAAQPKTLPR